MLEKLNQEEIQREFDRLDELEDRTIQDFMRKIGQIRYEKAQLRSEREAGVRRVVVQSVGNPLRVMK